MPADPKTKTVRLNKNQYAELRKQVGKRAGWRCQNCGRFIPLTFDGVFDIFTCGHVRHIKSRGSGGGDTLENTEYWCYDCHIAGEHGLKFSGNL